MRKLHLGIIAEFNAIPEYLHSSRYAYPNLLVTAVTSADPAEQKILHRMDRTIRFYPDAEGILSDPDVQIVLNLSAPADRGRINRACILAKKHVYSGFPIASDIKEAQALTALAASGRRKLLFCGAPDLLLSAPVQRMRALIGNGFLGTVLGAVIDCPLVRKTPCYETLNAQEALPITLAAYLLGNITAVSAVGCATTVNASLKTDKGAQIHLLATSDSPLNRDPRFEIYGTRGCLSLPDMPFGGRHLDLTDHTGITTSINANEYPYFTQIHGAGLSDMASVLLRKEKIMPRTDARILCHVMDVQNAIRESAATGETVAVHTSFDRTEPVSKLIQHGRKPRNAEYLASLAENSYLLPDDHT